MEQIDYDKNKFAKVLFNVVKDNIMNGKNPKYNPIFLYGLTRKDRFEVFWRVFNKDFNQKYKEKYIYLNCKDLVDFSQIDKNEKVMIIIENIEYLIGNNEAQKELYNFITDCLFETNIQLILCSDNNIEDLNFDVKIKARILSGLVTQLKK